MHLGTQMKRTERVKEPTWGKERLDLSRGIDTREGICEFMGIATHFWVWLHVLANALDQDQHLYSPAAVHKGSGLAILDLPCQAPQLCLLLLMHNSHHALLMHNSHHALHHALLLLLLKHNSHHAPCPNLSLRWSHTPIEAPGSPWRSHTYPYARIALLTMQGTHCTTHHAMHALHSHLAMHALQFSSRDAQIALLITQRTQWTSYHACPSSYVLLKVEPLPHHPGTRTPAHAHIAPLIMPRSLEPCAAQS